MIQNVMLLFLPLLFHCATSFQQISFAQSCSKSILISPLRSTSDNSDAIPEINFLDNSRPDTERRPIRLVKENQGKKKERKKETIQSRFEQWGVETIDDPSQRPSCEGTMDAVAQAAFHAISSTLYGRNYLDPNIVSNAMAVSVADRRPVGFAYFPQGRDVGRLGIEIDGARFLMSDMHGSRKTENDERNDRIKRDLASYDLSKSINGRMTSQRQHEHHILAMEGRALRRLSIVLASKLSQMPWEGMENREMYDGEGIVGEEPSSRPIALFFNTIRQALEASNELKLLQKVAALNGQKDLYHNVRILCMGQDEIPKDMANPPTTDINGKRRRKWGISKELSEGRVDPTRGLVIIVQPTDLNNESSPPSPSIGTVQQLQGLLAKSSIAQIPAVVMSPRLTEQFDGRGIEQSGYQQSSTYGGVEVRTFAI
jgi:hypothetical protein